MIFKTLSFNKNILHYFPPV